MRYLLIAVVLWSSACAMEFDCSYSFSAAGMQFCYDTPFDVEPDLAMVEEIVQIIEDSSALYYPQVQSLPELLQANEIVVYVTSADIRGECQMIGGEFALCYTAHSGLCAPSKNIIFIKQPSRSNTCFMRSALAHEILHIIDYRYFDNVGHDTPKMFIENYSTDEERIDTIEWHASYLQQSLIASYPEHCF